MKKQTYTLKLCKKQIKTPISHLIILTLGLIVFNLISLNTEAQTTVKVLVVAGGGSGGTNVSGGGGGGGVIYNASYSVSAQVYSVTVGNGGIGDGINGGNSVFGTLTAIGGGGGGKSTTGIASDGGSGGGGSAAPSSVGANGTSGQGNNGGAGSHTGNPYPGGGGGGAGAVGGNGSGSQAGNGGAGIANSISGSSVTYAGGGGAGAVGPNGGSAGSGGSGGGGRGDAVTGGSAVSGTANTGGGGGGCGGSGTQGNGGSGIVIISYPTGTISSTGGTITTSSGNTIHTFTSSGTFTVAGSPTVTSPTATSITSTGATLGANVISDGGATITARGTCWGTSANPTTNCIAEGNTTIGVFTHARTGLPAGTLIYYRGYATNSAGTGYSADGTFTPLDNPTVTTPTVTSITTNTATLGANVTSDGGTAITARGTCWGTSANPTANCVAEGGTTTGIFAQARTGMSTGTLIYYRGFATNSVGTGYSADGTFTTLFTPATVNWNNSNVQEITLSANRSFSFINGKSGGLYTLLIKQNTTGGWAVTWPENVEWAGGIAPTLTTTASAFDIIKFVYDGSNYAATGITLNIHH